MAELGFHPPVEEVVKKVLECMFCSKKFTHLVGLRSHLYHKHTKGLLNEHELQMPKRPPPMFQRVFFTRQCPLCECPNMRVSQLDPHLSAEHFVDTTFHTLTFLTFQEFLMWKLKYSAATSTEYVMEKQAVRGGVVFKKYVCQQGKKLTQPYCPAKILAYCKSNGRIDIQYLKTHVRHAIDVDTLKKSTMEYLKSKATMVEELTPTTDRRLLRGIVEKHQTKRPVLRTCVDCGFTDNTNKLMNEHLASAHGHDVHPRTVEFPSLGDFATWLEQYSTETRAWYVRKGPIPVVGKRSTFHFACNRHLQCDIPKRYQGFGSKNLKGYCPARITVTLNQDGTVNARYITWHAHVPTPRPSPKVVEPRIPPRIAPRIEPHIEFQIEPEVEPQIEFQMEPEVEPQIEFQIELQSEPQIGPRIAPRIVPQKLTYTPHKKKEDIIYNKPRVISVLKSIKRENEAMVISTPITIEEESEPMMIFTPKDIKIENEVTVISAPKAIVRENEAKVISPPKATKRKNQAKVTSPPKGIKRKNQAKVTSPLKAIKRKNQAKTISLPKFIKRDNRAMVISAPKLSMGENQAMVISAQHPMSKVLNMCVNMAMMNAAPTIKTKRPRPVQRAQPSPAIDVQVCVTPSPPPPPKPATISADFPFDDYMQNDHSYTSPTSQQKPLYSSPTAYPSPELIAAAKRTQELMARAELFQRISKLLDYKYEHIAVLDNVVTMLQGCKDSENCMIFKVDKNKI